MMTKYLWVLGISLLPIVELKGAIPVGLGLGIPLLTSFFIALFGSCLMGIIIVVFASSVLKYMRHSRIKVFNSVSNWAYRKVEKHRSKIDRFGYWGVFVFVAIPLPGTGVWTGALIAAVLGLRVNKAIPAVVFGNVIAGLAIMLLSYSVGTIISNVS